MTQTRGGRFHYHQLDLEHMTAAWLLPIVPTVVAAASGGIVAGSLSPDLAFVTLTISYMLWWASLPVLDGFLCGFPCLLWPAR